MHSPKRIRFVFVVTILEVVRASIDIGHCYKLSLRIRPDVEWTRGDLKPIEK